MSSNTEKQFRRDARWNLIFAMYNGRNLGITDKMAVDIFSAMDYEFSIPEIKSMFTYLEESGFCRSETKIDKSTRYIITSKGVELVEGDCECPQSISRPEDGWF